MRFVKDAVLNVKTLNLSYFLHRNSALYDWTASRLLTNVKNLTKKRRRFWMVCLPKVRWKSARELLAFMICRFFMICKCRNWYFYVSPSSLTPTCLKCKERCSCVKNKINLTFLRLEQHLLRISQIMCLPVSA